MNGVSSQPEITRIMLAILTVGGLLVASFWVLRPFLPALIWSTMIVVATWPVLLGIERRLGGRRGWAVTAMTFLLLLILVVPLYLAVTTIVDHAGEITGLVKALPTMTIPPPPDWLGKIPFAGERITTHWREVAEAGPGALAARLAPYLKGIANWFAGQVGNVGLLVVHLILVIIISAVFWASGEKAARSVRRFVRRLMGPRGEESVTLAGQAIRAVALGIVVTAVIQSTLAWVGLEFSGVGYAGLLAAVAFILCIAQLGPGLVLIPAVAWVYWSGDNVLGTVLLVWSIFVGTIDNFLRPILIQRGANLPLWLVFSGVIGGLIGFGIIGLFIGPVVLAVTYTGLTTWVADIDHRKGGDVEDAAESTGRAEGVAIPAGTVVQPEGNPAG